MHINDPFATRASGRLPDNASIEDMLNLLDSDRGLSRALSGFSFLGKTREQANQKTSPTSTKPTSRTGGTITRPQYRPPVMQTPTTKPKPKPAPAPSPLIPRDAAPPYQKPLPAEPSYPDIMYPRDEAPGEKQPSISINVSGGDSSGGGGTSTPGETGLSVPEQTYDRPTFVPVTQESKPMPWMWIALGAAALFLYMQKKSA